MIWSFHEGFFRQQTCLGGSIWQRRMSDRIFSPRRWTDEAPGLSLGRESSLWCGTKVLTSRLLRYE
jgi:hypothetical protein